MRIIDWISDVCSSDLFYFSLTLIVWMVITWFHKIGHLMINPDRGSAGTTSLLFCMGYVGFISLYLNSISIHNKFTRYSTINVRPLMCERIPESFRKFKKNPRFPSLLILPEKVSSGTGHFSWTSISYTRLISLLIW